MPKWSSTITRVGDCAREREELAVLVVVVPRVVGQAALAEPGDAGTECRILEEPGGRAARDHEAVARFGSRQRVTDAAEQSAARFGVRVEHLVEVRQPQVGVTDDAGDHARRCARAAAATNSVSPTGASSAGPSVR